jgi:hypothetical protein
VFSTRLRDQAEISAKGMVPKTFRLYARSTPAKTFFAVDYQWTLPLAPGPPGVNFPSSDILSPGTGVPDVADWETESSLIESSDVAQAESTDATAKNRTVRSAKRSFTPRT